jgi:WD40 repeat protein/class 3 adenylate cyclase/energy-coupling factor transporter ATP-binding protein EcfA2
MLVFFFTDIEGSTRLWEEHTDDMGEVIARHDAILQQQIAESGGRITKHTGDGVTAAFEGGQPLTCALEAQKQFAAADWGAISELRIRVGLHAGEAEFQASAGTPAGDYFGPPVNATARVMSAAWGGQVLLTPEVIQASPLPADATLRDLGEHLLKNVSAPQQLYQLDHPQLPWREFPPPRTLSGQSIRQAVDERGSHLAGLDPAGMATGLVTAVLLPALQGELDPESGALEGNLGVLGDLGAGILRAFTARFAGQLRARQEAGEAPGLPEIQALLGQELQTQWQAGGETAAVLRADASRLLQAVRGVEATMATASGEIKEALARGLADLGGRFAEFRWMLDGLQETLAEVRARQALQLALQREQLDLQREQLVKTNLLLHRRRGGPALAELAVEGEVEEPPPADVPCPYKGLAAFEADDAQYFFGREELVAELTARLAGTRFMAVVGPSGSGKSSLVRAGLLPSVWAGALPDSEDWQTLVITPGAHPLEELAVRVSLLKGIEPSALHAALQARPQALHLAVKQALANEPEPAKLLLVIDQFEEIFALCRDEDEQRQFINALLYAVEAEDGPTIVVPTVRADFYGRCADYPQLAARMSDGLLVGPMSEDELRAAIERPAAVVGLRLEPGLVETILDDVAGEPGALPLLSHALLETFARRRGAELPLSGYAASGGVAGAIAQTADTVYSQLSLEQQTIARNILLRLTELGEEGTQDTRRRAAPGELSRSPEEASRVEAVLKTLADARLITTGEDTVEVAHEALIREWPALRAWLDEDREGLRVQRHLTEAAQEWERLEREPGELYRGARLAAASEWEEQHADLLNPLEREFLEASQELAQRREREREAQRQRELEAAQKLAEAEGKRAEEQARATSVFRRLAVVLAGVFLVAVAAAVFARGQQQQAVTAANSRATEVAVRSTAEADSVAARATAEADSIRAEREARAALEAYSLSLGVHAQQALSDKDTASALVLALAANSMDQPPAKSLQTLRETAYAPGPRRRFSLADTFPGVEGKVYSLAASPDERLFLIGFDDGTLVLWDLDTESEIHRLVGHSALVRDVAIGPDGQTALSCSNDRTMILWDLNTGREIRRFHGHAGWVRAVAFSPDGRTAVSGGFVGDSVVSVLNPGELILWNLETGQEIRRFGGETEGHPSGVQDVAFSPDGRTLLASSGLLADVRPEYSLMLWDVQTGEVVHSFEVEHDNFSLAIHPDGQTALTGAMDHNVYLWDLGTGERIQTFEGHQTLVTTVAFAPNGRRAMSGDWNGRLILWDLPTGSQIMQAKVHHAAVGWSAIDPPPVNVAVGPEGRLALSSAGDGSLILWDLFDAGEIRRFEGHATSINGVAFTPDGEHALTGAGFFGYGPVAEDNSLRLWDVETGELIRVLEGHRMPVLHVAISSDGRRALSGAGDATMRLWDLESGREIRSFKGYPDEVGVFCVAISPDGRTALSGSLTNDSMILWDLESGEMIHRFVTGENFTTLLFNPDGRTAFVGSVGLQLFDLDTGREIRRVSDDADCCTDFAIHPDGRTAFVVGNYDRILREWDLENDREIRAFGEHNGFRTRVALNPDGRTMLSSGWDGTLFLWDLETGQLIRRFASYENGFIMDIAISPDGRAALVSGTNSAVILWRLDLPSSADGVREWIATNRYVRELTCEERETYRITPLCDQ